MDILTYRGAEPSDAGTVAALHTLSWRDAYRGLLPESYLAGPIEEERAALWKDRFATLGAAEFRVFLAEAPDGPCGFSCVLADEDPAWGACLDNLHVLPAWKGRGVGRRLFDSAAAWVMDARPGSPLHLWVFEANAGARRLYDALEGEIVERRRKEAAAGIEVASVLYVWRNLARLRERLKDDPVRRERDGRSPRG